jgi:uncharacterized protein YfaS (alpha-2-macroglobulin family)
MKLDPIASEREVTEAAAFRLPQAEGGRFLFVKVAKGMKSPGGYLLGSDRLEILQIKTFAPELSIMSRGSLLALSGEKKLPLLVRDLPGVKIDIARVLPQQLHLLVSQADGNFSQPQFYGRVNDDTLAEHFEREIPLKLKPGKSHYETVDFAEYLQAGGERRGVFLLKVQGYDPAAKRGPATGGDEGDASAMAGGEGEGEGEGCCEGGDAEAAEWTPPPSTTSAWSSSPTWA